MIDGLKFGTSGLRGLVSDLDDAICQNYARAFIEHMKAAGPMTGMLVGYDLRASSPAIAKSCLSAAAGAGLQAINCGALPTPALALQARLLGLPAIMVTGSHIPEDRNGLKFYRRNGEIDKADETGIAGRLGQATPAPLVDIPPGTDGLEHYLARYRGVGVLALTGLTIGVYQHSSVARDVMVEVLSHLGATCLPFGRADRFVPVDTEAHRPGDVALVRQWAGDNHVDAVVSTDGDGDRPLIADARGSFLRGDSVGLLTAQMLGADIVVTPVTSNSAVEQSGLFRQVRRTRIGSPYVIEAMEAERAQARGPVIGYEANGGVLLGSDVVLGGERLTALPTRDAMLPIIAVLALARRRGLSLEQLVGSLPARFTASDRLPQIPAERSAVFLGRLADEGAFRARFLADIGDLQGLDRTDGIRLLLADGAVVHFRASGNAPELRCYTEAPDAEGAQSLLAWGLGKARTELGGGA